MALPERDFSRNQLRKAGEILRRGHRHSALAPNDPNVMWAIGVLDEFRAAHGTALEHVMSGLMQMLMTEPTGATEIGSRFPKRIARIIEKMARQGCGFERLQDIAGVRIVVEDGITGLYKVRDLITTRFQVTKEDDYVDQPSPTGYRAIHLVVERDGYPVELQLRTVPQHYWAESVEEAESRLGFPLKDGDGPRDLLDYFRVASERTALQEAGKPADASLDSELDDLRERVRHYYRRSDER